MQNKTYGVTIDIPETLVEELLSRGKKPPLILSKIAKRMILEMDIDEIIDYAEGSSSPSPSYETSQKEKPIMQKKSLTSHAWTLSLFEDYMKKLIVQAQRRASVADLISMLIAYIGTSSRPTSEELREERGFGSGEKWYEELRTSKARLTIAAKHMGLPSFFSRAYGSGLNRRHPMDEDVYKFLCKWASRNKNIVKNYKKVATPRSTD